MFANLPQKARDHFYGLREAKEDLAGIAIFDRLDKELDKDVPLAEAMWSRREIENYFCTDEVLLAYAAHDQPNDLFGAAEADRRRMAMQESINELSQALITLNRPEPWSPDLKVTDEFLDPLFRRYFKKLGLPLTLRKSDYYVLSGLVKRAKIDPEVVAKLDAIVEAARTARPRE